jgi:membrane protease YdiL (CAAX protease family)
MKHYKTLLIVLVLIAIALDIINTTYDFSDTYSFLIQTAIRTICIVFVFLIIKEHNIKINSNKYPIIITFIIFIPSLIVSILNFPLDNVINKEIIFNIDTSKLITYILFTLSIAISEELLFRGLFTSIPVSQIDNSKYRVIIRVFYVSIIFSLVHLLNLFTSDILSVLLQVGYTFILGVMLTTLYIYTKNIIFCIIVHFIYNFVGTFTDYFSNSYYESNMYIIWIIEGILVGSYILFLLYKMTKKDILDYNMVIEETNNTIE